MSTPLTIIFKYIEVAHCTACWFAERECADTFCTHPESPYDDGLTIPDYDGEYCAEHCGHFMPALEWGCC